MKEQPLSSVHKHLQYLSESSWISHGNASLLTQSRVEWMKLFHWLIKMIIFCPGVCMLWIRFHSFSQYLQKRACKHKISLCFCSESFGWRCEVRAERHTGSVSTLLHTFIQRLTHWKHRTSRFISARGRRERCPNGLYRRSSDRNHSMRKENRLFGLI